jgi:hypothetical protein
MSKDYITGNGQPDNMTLDIVSKTLNCMHDQLIVLKDRGGYGA